LISFIKSKEGLRLEAYADHGQYSIGYGTKASGPDEVITEAEAERRLLAEVKKRKDYVVNFGKKYNYDWNENQIDALTSFAYNVGSLDQLTANGKRSNEEIAQMMPENNKASGKTIPALVQRRNEEVAMFGGNGSVPTMLASTKPATPQGTPSSSVQMAATTPRVSGTQIAAASAAVDASRMQAMAPASIVPVSSGGATPKTPGPQAQQVTIPSTLDSDLFDALIGRATEFA
jgi:GH24 family phage-related lysozyme (muramidase)